MKKKSLILLFTGVMLSSLLIGCGSQNINSEQSTQATEVVEQGDKDKELVDKNKDKDKKTFDKQKDKESFKMSSDNLINSIKVTDLASKSNPNENMMFSPISLNYALGMISDGAVDETKSLLDTYLGTENYGEFAENYLKLIDRYNSGESDYGYTTCLEIADALWVSDEYKLKSDYEDTVRSKYDAVVKSLNFANVSDSVNEINSWVNDKTHEMIKQIVSEDMFDADSVMCLTNTVYFEAPWSDCWNYAEGYEEEFTNFDGSTNKLCYMYGSPSAYYENDNATAFGYNYSNGIQFVGILPKSTGDFELSDLDIAGLLETSTTKYDVEAKMPRLTFDSTINLNDILAEMGLESIFTDDAKFTEITDEFLKVSTVLQKTRIELDENGTKASAATAIMMDKLGAVIEDEREVKQVSLDRPFAFMIYDAFNDETLFIGKVVNVK
jgi:serpin B